MCNCMPDNGGRLPARPWGASGGRPRGLLECLWTGRARQRWTSLCARGFAAKGTHDGRADHAKGHAQDRGRRRRDGGGGGLARIWGRQPAKGDTSDERLHAAAVALRLQRPGAASRRADAAGCTTTSTTPPTSKGSTRRWRSSTPRARRNDYAASRPFAQTLAFHGSGHVLHSLFWHSMTPGGGQSHRAVRGPIWSAELRLGPGRTRPVRRRHQGRRGQRLGRAGLRAPGRQAR